MVHHGAARSSAAAAARQTSGRQGGKESGWRCAVQDMDADAILGAACPQSATLMILAGSTNCGSR